MDAETNVVKITKKPKYSTYFRRSWMLYLMLVLPMAFIVLFRYVPMTNIVIAFTNYNMFQGVWARGGPFCHELEPVIPAAETADRPAATAGAMSLADIFAADLFADTDADAQVDPTADYEYIYTIEEIEEIIAAPIVPAAGSRIFTPGHSAACGRTVCCRVYGHRVGCGHFVGFDWFRTAFQRADFWNAVRNTLLLNFLDLLFGFPAPIILALLLNELLFKKFKKVTQTIIYLPHFLSWIIISSMATRLLSPTTGVINVFLGENFGIGPINFLMDNVKWIFTYIGFGVWRSMGWGTIIYLAAIAGISPELYEAAEVDGAGRWRKLWHVTLPGIRPVIFILLIMNIGHILGIELDRPFTMANDIVRDVADVLSTYVYRVGILAAQFSLTAAIGLFQSVVGVIFLLGANVLAKKAGERGIW